jgi:long-subunit acyl-CoA synthetase (AMP-forming)
MEITTLVARLPEQKAHSIISFENGRVVKRTHADVYADVQAACDRLTAWGLKPGMRVGIRAPNSYQWIIYDLALIQIRAVSVAFTDDFAQMSAEELCEKYSLSLIFVTSKEGSRDPEKSPFIAYIDGDNDGVKVIDRGTLADDESFDKPGLIFSSGSTGGLRGLVLNRKGIEESVDSFTQVIAPREDDSVVWLRHHCDRPQPSLSRAQRTPSDDPHRAAHALRGVRDAVFQFAEMEATDCESWRRGSAQAA